MAVTDSQTIDGIAYGDSTARKTAIDTGIVDNEFNRNCCKAEY